MVDLAEMHGCSEFRKKGTSLRGFCVKTPLQFDPGLLVPNNFRSTPLMINGVLYASDGIGLVEAFDPSTGKTIWVQEPPESTPEVLAGAATRSIGTGAAAPMNAFRARKFSSGIRGVRPVLNPQRGKS